MFLHKYRRYKDVRICIYIYHAGNSNCILQFDIQNQFLHTKSTLFQGQRVQQTCQLICVFSCLCLKTLFRGFVAQHRHDERCSSRHTSPSMQSISWGAWQMRQALAFLFQSKKQLLIVANFCVLSICLHPCLHSRGSPCNTQLDCSESYELLLQQFHRSTVK